MEDKLILAEGENCMKSAAHDLDTDSGESDDASYDDRTFKSTHTPRQDSLHYPVMESAGHGTGVHPNSMKVSDHVDDTCFMDQVPSLEEFKDDERRGPVSVGTTDDRAPIKPSGRPGRVGHYNKMHTEKYTDLEYRTGENDLRSSEPTGARTLKLIESLVAKRFQKDRISTHREMYDCVVVYERRDYEEVQQFVNDLHHIAEKRLSDLGNELKVELYDAEGKFSTSMVQSPKDVAEKCSLVLVYLTSNFGSSDLEFFIEEAISMQRFASTSDRKPFQIRPVHTKPKSNRDYRTPAGFISTPGIEWFDKDSSFTRDKIVTTLREAMKKRIELEKDHNLAEDIKMIETGGVRTGKSNMEPLGQHTETHTRQRLLYQAKTRGDRTQYNGNPLLAERQMTPQQLGYMAAHTHGMPTTGPFAPSMIPTQPRHPMPPRAPATMHSQAYDNRYFSNMEPRMSPAYPNGRPAYRMEIRPVQPNPYTPHSQYELQHSHRQQQLMRSGLPIDPSQVGIHRQIHENIGSVHPDDHNNMTHMMQMMSNTRLPPSVGYDRARANPVKAPISIDLNQDNLPSYRSIDSTYLSNDGRQVSVNQISATRPDRHSSELTTNDVEIDTPGSVNLTNLNDDNARVSNASTKSRTISTDNVHGSDDDANDDDDSDDDSDDGDDGLWTMFKGKPDGSVVNIVGSQIVQIGHNNKVIGQISDQRSPKSDESSDENDDDSDEQSDNDEKVACQESRKPINDSGKLVRNIHVSNRQHLQESIPASMDDLESVKPARASDVRFENKFELIDSHNTTDELGELPTNMMENNFDDDDDVRITETAKPKPERVMFENNSYGTRDRSPVSNTTVCDNLPSKDRTADSSVSRKDESPPLSFHGPQSRHVLSNQVLFGNLPMMEGMHSFSSANNDSEELD